LHEAFERQLVSSLGQQPHFVVAVYLRQVLAMGDRIVLTVDRAEVAQGLIEQTLRQAGVGAVRISATEPGLEDIFVQTMRSQED